MINFNIRRQTIPPAAGVPGGEAKESVALCYKGIVIIDTIFPAKGKKLCELCNELNAAFKQETMPHFHIKFASVPDVDPNTPECYSEVEAAILYYKDIAINCVASSKSEDVEKLKTMRDKLNALVAGKEGSSD